MLELTSSNSSASVERCRHESEHSFFCSSKIIPIRVCICEPFLRWQVLTSISLKISFMHPIHWLVCHLGSRNHMGLQPSSCFGAWHSSPYLEFLFSGCVWNCCGLMPWPLCLLSKVGWSIPVPTRDAIVLGTHSGVVSSCVIHELFMCLRLCFGYLYSVYTTACRGCPTVQRRCCRIFPLVFTWGSNQLTYWVNSSVTWEPRF